MLILPRRGGHARDRQTDAGFEVGLSNGNTDGRLLFRLYYAEIDAIPPRDHNAVFVLFCLLESCLRFQKTLFSLVLFNMETELRRRQVLIATLATDRFRSLWPTSSGSVLQLPSFRT